MFLLSFAKKVILFLMIVSSTSFVWAQEGEQEGGYEEIGAGRAAPRRRICSEGVHSSSDDSSGSSWRGSSSSSSDGSSSSDSSSGTSSSSSSSSSDGSSSSDSSRGSSPALRKKTPYLQVFAELVKLGFTRQQLQEDHGYSQVQMTTYTTRALEKGLLSEEQAKGVQRSTFKKEVIEGIKGGKTFKELHALTATYRVPPEHAHRRINIAVGHGYREEKLTAADTVPYKKEAKKVYQGLTTGRLFDTPHDILDFLEKQVKAGKTGFGTRKSLYQSYQEAGYPSSATLGFAGFSWQINKLLEYGEEGFTDRPAVKVGTAVFNLLENSIDKTKGGRRK